MVMDVFLEAGGCFENQLPVTDTCACAQVPGGPVGTRAPRGPFWEGRPQANSVALEGAGEKHSSAPPAPRQHRGPQPMRVVRPVARALSPDADLPVGCSGVPGRRSRSAWGALSQPVPAPQEPLQGRPPGESLCPRPRVPVECWLAVGLRLACWSQPQPHPCTPEPRPLTRCPRAPLGPPQPPGAGRCLPRLWPPGAQETPQGYIWRKPRWEWSLRDGGGFSVPPAPCPPWVAGKR